VKKAAVEIVQGLTGTREGIKSLLSKADSLSGLLIDIIKCEEVLNKPGQTIVYCSLQLLRFMLIHMLWTCVRNYRSQLLKLLLTFHKSHNMQRPSPKLVELRRPWILLES
jgi:hypothetical protein